MVYQIDQLNREDYEEAIDFINMVFSLGHSPTNFPELLPTYYKKTEEHMRCHYAIKGAGRILALVGIYPGEMVIGSKVFSIARVGAVSTHPYHRGGGLMKTLMSHCMNVIQEQGYDLANLGGLRHRYLNYGFEKCGSKFVFTLNEHNLKYFDKNKKAIEIKAVKPEDREIIIKMKEIHDRQPIRFNRREDKFYDICLSWKHVPYAFYKDGNYIGYLVTDKEKKYISEIAADSENIQIEMLQAFAEKNEKKTIEIEIGSTNIYLAKSLGRVCEQTRVDYVANWRIFNWEDILKSLLKTKSSYFELEDGEVILGIQGYGNVRLYKYNEDIGCNRTEEEPSLVAEPWQMCRLLFGPLEPRYVTEIPLRAGIINSWGTLPLYSSEQDFA